MPFVPQNNSQRWPILLILIIGLLWLRPAPANAQTINDYYWQRSASGRLRHLQPIDINHDGVDELLLADQSGKIDLIDAQGRRLWSFDAEEPIMALRGINVHGPKEPNLEIVVGISNRLILLNTNGEPLWEIPLTARSAPIPLLTSSGQEIANQWLAAYAAFPADIAAVNTGANNPQHILVLLQSGQLQLFDENGQLQWRYQNNIPALLNSTPRIAVSDMDGDGRSEIVHAFYNGRFSQVTLLNTNGIPRWDQDLPISGHVTNLLPISFSQSGTQQIAIGTDRGQLLLYEASRQRVWMRTLNKPITALTIAQLPEGPGLVAGTGVGGVIVYNEQGRRVWARFLAPEANKEIVSLSAAPFVPPSSQPMLMAVIRRQGGVEEPADVILLGNDGRTLNTLPAIDVTGLSRLLDINHDGKSELLLARFATIELQGLGIGASTNAQEWEYSLFAAPHSWLVIDFDQDGQDELLVGAKDGRLHRLNSNGSIRWVIEPGGDISYLATLPTSPISPPNFVVARNATIQDPSGTQTIVGWVELRRANGEQIWEQPLFTEITSLLVTDVNTPNQPQILVGTAAGRIIAFGASGSQLWETSLPERVNYLLTMGGTEKRPFEIVAATQNHIYKLGTTPSIIHMAVFDSPIVNIFPLNQPGNELASALLVLLADGTARGLNWRGIQLPEWPLPLHSPPQVSLAAHHLIEEAFQVVTANPDASNPDSFLIATEDGRLLWLNINDNHPFIRWQLTGLGKMTALFYGDLDGDALADLAIGNRDGRVRIYTNAEQESPKLAPGLNLFSSVYAITSLRNNQRANLLVITENGLVQLFRAQENWPPLLTAPQVELSQGQFNFRINVLDVEQDPVTVQLQLHDPATGEWIPQESHIVENGEGVPFWFVRTPPNNTEGLAYRFFYDDGFHRGYITPPVGPPVTGILFSEIPRTLLTGASILLAILAVLFMRQAQTPTARAQRFYRRLKQQPQHSLLLLENKYAHTGGAPNFWLHLAAQARQENDQLIAGLADALFLLADRPLVGLPIITSMLAELENQPEQWVGFTRWQKVMENTKLLLEAPSITELSLLRPQLMDLLTFLEQEGAWMPLLDALLPVLTNLRDSERVEQAEDRLVYLNEALVLLHQLRDQLPDFEVNIEKTLITAVVNRWIGLVNAAIEELRGRADPVVTLKTKRLAPTKQTELVFEIKNNGRSPAENIILELANDPAYKVLSPPQIISFLPPRRTRQVSFTIEPQVADRFRIALTITYDDPNGQDKELAFGDMVHLLPPTREFKPIPNPYLPGSPLRRHSTLFYGREELFQFIAQNVSRTDQRNVLILIGQRRTGKTSILLRLEQHLPDHVIPVYIDCQSLGVTPGMPALFHDLAWLIADTLITRNIELEIPALEHWETDPTGLFQRTFLPQVKKLLPDHILLFVFDEFEALQNLVEDGILPATFFTYLRHLMQHSDRLGFIFVGTRRLEEMSADYWSVLFNIALYRKIGYLDEQSARRLICEPVSPNLVYDDLALDKILRVTAGHPYFLQLVCYTLVKQANTTRTGYVTISDVNTALDEMLKLGEAHFAYLWQQSTFAERALLTAVSQLMDHGTTFHPADLVSHLENYDIHLSPAEVTTALNRLVERDILNEISEKATTAYELRVGLVGLWVSRHKSLSHLYADNGSPHISARLHQSNSPG
ncbi:MAG: hypothetical protein D6706_04750 [Chloroflexi bacterium]|nr:MAG: hypothetical protein D6706_04750 [Chloroflexota bacterium]